MLQSALPRYVVVHSGDTANYYAPRLDLTEVCS